MKTSVRAYDQTMPILSGIAGLLSGLAMVSYALAHYSQTVDDLLQQHLPSGNTFLRWLMAV